MRTSRLNGIQCMRGVAASMVVLFHLNPRFERVGISPIAPDWLGGGVDIFFVISGFIMWTTTVNDHPSSYTFMTRRLTRIAPLYWVVTTFTIAVNVLAPSLLPPLYLDLPLLIGSYLFVPVMNPKYQAMEPVVPQGWTLNLEMLFYVVFAIVVTFEKLKRLLLIAIVMSLIVTLSWIFGDYSPSIKFYGRSILFEFLLGMLVGVMYSNGVKLPMWMGAGSMLLGFVALCSSSLVPYAPQLFTLGLPAMFIVGGAVLLEPFFSSRNFRILGFIGDSSYSLYLVHGIVLTAVLTVCRKLGFFEAPVYGTLGFAVLGTIAALLGGSALYQYVERPLSSLFHRRSKPMTVCKSIS